MAASRYSNSEEWKREQREQQQQQRQYAAGPVKPEKPADVILRLYAEKQSRNNQSLTPAWDGGVYNPAKDPWARLTLDNCPASLDNPVSMACAKLVCSPPVGINASPTSVTQDDTDERIDQWNCQRDDALETRGGLNLNIPRYCPVATQQWHLGIAPAMAASANGAARLECEKYKRETDDNFRYGTPFKSNPFGDSERQKTLVGHNKVPRAFNVQDYREFGLARDPFAAPQWC